MAMLGVKGEREGEGEGEREGEGEGEGEGSNEAARAIDGDEVLLVLGDDVRVGVLRVDQVAVAHLVRVRIRVKG